MSTPAAAAAVARRPRPHRRSLRARRRARSWRRALRVLAARYRSATTRRCCFAAEGFLAGPDEHRLAELRAALADPEARAIFLARGGYGLLRLLPLLDPALLRARPRPIVGFSDGTALLALAARAGVASVHGPVVTQLHRLPRRRSQRAVRPARAPRPGPAAVRPGAADPRPRAGPPAGRQPGGVLPPAGHALPARPGGRRAVPRGHRRAPLPHRSPDHPPGPGGRVQRRLRRWCWASSRTAASPRARR